MQQHDNRRSHRSQWREFVPEYHHVDPVHADDHQDHVGPESDRRIIGDPAGSIRRDPCDWRQRDG
jgi:hypothetical protein